MNPEEGDLVEQGGNEFHEKARVPRVAFVDESILEG